jgi:hypothetical protein
MIIVVQSTEISGIQIFSATVTGYSFVSGDTTSVSTLLGILMI